MSFSISNMSQKSKLFILAVLILLIIVITLVVIFSSKSSSNTQGVTQYIGQGVENTPVYTQGVVNTPVYTQGITQGVNTPVYTQGVTQGVNTPVYTQGVTQGVNTPVYTQPPTQPPTQSPSAYTLVSMPKSALFNTDNLNNPGNSVYSPNRQYELLLEPTGNVKISKISDNSIIWRTNTTASSAQPNINFSISNGNIILKSTALSFSFLSFLQPASTTLWQSSTSGSGGTKLVLRNDGKLVLYDDTLTRAVWSS